MVTPEAGRSATALSSERPTSSWARLTHRIARSAPTACAAATIPSRTRWGFRVSSTRSLVLTGSPSDPLATTTGRRRPEPAGRRTAAILRAVGKPAPPLPRNPARRPRTRGRPGKERAPSGARGRRTRCRPAPTEAGATGAGSTRRPAHRRHPPAAPTRAMQVTTMPNPQDRPASVPEPSACRMARGHMAHAPQWTSLAKIVVDVVADGLDDARLEGLLGIGVDEVSYRKGHRFLTVVADHDRQGAVVWAGEGKGAATLRDFYDTLGEERCRRLEAVSLDMGAAYKTATDAKAPDVRQCVDPFHLVQLANAAVDKSRRWAWNEARRRHRTEKGPLGRTRTMRTPEGWIKQTRWALLKDPDSLKDSQLAILHALRREHSVLYRAWQLKEGLRDLYRVRPADAPAHMTWWLAWASRCRIPAFVALAKTVRLNRERILAAIELGLSNSKLEGLNSKIRLINHRGYGHHSAAAVIAMIYLCCGGITVELPTDRVPSAAK